MAMVQRYGGRFESMDLAAMLGDSEKLPKEVSLKLSSKDGDFTKLSSILRCAFLSQMEVNEYSTLKKNGVALQNGGAKNVDVNQFLNSLSTLDAEVHIPYVEDFDLEQAKDITVTYDPIIRDDWSEGVKITDNGQEYVSRVDDPYSQENLTLLVLERDTSVFIPTTREEMLSKVESSMRRKVFLQEATIVDQGLLTSNVPQDYFSGDDIVYTVIPRMRVRGTGWIPFTATKLKLVLARATGEIKFDANGNLIPGATTFILANPQPFSKQELKDAKWVDVNISWDDDWELFENTQQVILLSSHSLAVAADVTGSVKIGWKNGVPSPEIGYSVNFSFKQRSSRLRYNNELSRRSLLGFNVGGLSSSVYTENNVPYTIRTWGQADMYFNIFYTKVRKR